MPDSTAVYACEPQPIVIEGLRRVVEKSEELVFSGASSAIEASVDEIRLGRPNVVLVDQSYGMKLIGRFIADLYCFSPQSYVVLWVVECTPTDCFRALQLGARSMIRKTVPIHSLVECLLTVGGGNVWIEDSLSDEMAGYGDRDGSPRLTARERDIVRCVCRGLKNRDIAAELGITPGTVKVHLMHIFEKTGVKDRFELALRGRRFVATNGDAGESAMPAV